MDARGGAIVEIPKMNQMSHPIDCCQLIQNPLVCLRWSEWCVCTGERHDLCHFLGHLSRLLLAPHFIEFDQCSSYFVRCP